MQYDSIYAKKNSLYIFSVHICIQMLIKTVKEYTPKFQYKGKNEEPPSTNTSHIVSNSPLFQRKSLLQRTSVLKFFSTRLYSLFLVQLLKQRLFY